MSERIGSLSAEETRQTVDCFHDYIVSGRAVIRTISGSTSASGSPIHLDGAAFLEGFAAYLKAKGADSEKMLGVLSYIIKLAVFVRKGGVRLLRYRLETGRCRLVPDYFDGLSAAISGEAYVEAAAVPGDSLSRRLAEIDSGDEARVAEFISKIDDTLLELGRLLESESLAKIAALKTEER